MAFELVIKYFSTKGGSGQPAKKRVSWAKFAFCLSRSLMEDFGTDKKYAEIYIDKGTKQVAIFLTSTETSATRRLTYSKTNPGSVQIHCYRFLQDYHIKKGRTVDFTIEEIDGKRMIVFPVEVEAPNDD